MTQFLFQLYNHDELGQKSLEDVIGIVGHQLQALGHKASRNKDNGTWLARESGINVVVEGFTEASIDMMADGFNNGARFLILATEEPTTRGFNYGSTRGMRQRQEMFPHAARFCEGILHFVPGEAVTRWYSQFAPSAQAELGYAPSLVRPNDFFPPTFDFGFFGSLSGRRYSIIKKLANRTNKENGVRVCNDFSAQPERDKKMREAKVIIQLRKFERMGLVSSSRCNTALSIGRPVVAEPHNLSKPWDEIVKFSSTLEGFYDYAQFICATWKMVHAEQFDKFKRILTPEFCVGEPLRKIGLDLRPQPPYVVRPLVSEEPSPTVG